MEDRAWLGLLAGKRAVDGGGDLLEVLVETDCQGSAGGSSEMTSHPWDAARVAQLGRQVSTVAWH